MSTTIWLTDLDSELSGYKRAELGGRGPAPSLVRAVTATAAGPTAGLPVTRTAGGAALAWITPPLAGVALSAAAWTVRVWAGESAAAANAALRVQVLRWTTAEGSTIVDDNPGTELGTTVADLNRATAAATATTLAAGDRLVIKLLIDDAGTLAAGATVTVSYGGETPRAEGDSALVCPDNLVALGGLPAATAAEIRRLLRQEQVAGGAAPLPTDDEIATAAAHALVEYSRLRPRLAVAAASGDGTTYDFPLPGEWRWGSSRLVAVEYPAGDQTPALVDADDVWVHETTLGGQPVRVLRFQSTPVSGTNNILVRYTTDHLHTSERDTVPASDRPALCLLAAAAWAEMAAAWQAASSDSTISADGVDHRDGAQRWRSEARALRARALALLGGPAPAGLVADWDTALSNGADRLFHPRRRR